MIKEHKITVTKHWCCRVDNWVRRVLMLDASTYRRWSVTELGKTLVRVNKLGLR
jgi:hypothetical protein